MQNKEIHITGTLVWYYYICHREVWFMGRQIVPDQDNPNIDIGRFIGENAYSRESKKEIAVGNSRFDIIRNKEGHLVISEIKKSSKFKDSARMQLAFYLSELETLGITARGELLFPEEKRKETIVLDDKLRAHLEQARRDILRIMYLPVPPPAQKKSLCKNCAYAELCWA
ncbi:CRISPR-associated protein Cas4 [Desulfofarcimen acetoxidans DSM 771]|uniref:CRISPR-associated exonuclease Cas4 n=1 Tax=Desulfofarcimen acetoxidans (strain ATCC 49208 / DSM 771 / KCTC 5769 / VKM B-1644 / 5575) TaxID=485916 RepID=C8VZK9_DESAS|nr:CRISPR-associated protein Cas4 [Desulfofarcimen acetoxidans]ACV64954.1 CRISPR-associated protein Cas4 [Desulfofarcimen acetoxidans DSM 771]